MTSGYYEKEESIVIIMFNEPWEKGKLQGCKFVYLPYLMSVVIIKTA